MRVPEDETWYVAVVPVKAASATAVVATYIDGPPAGGGYAETYLDSVKVIAA